MKLALHGKFYAYRWAAKRVRKQFGSKSSIYRIMREAQRREFCNYYGCGYMEFTLAWDRLLNPELFK